MFSALNSYIEYEREINQICSLLNMSWKEAQALHKQMQNTVKEYPIYWDGAFYMATSLMSYGDWLFERWEQCLFNFTYFSAWKESKRINF